MSVDLAPVPLALPMKKDIRYVPTPRLVVQGMLDLAELTSGDTLYDLGSGDGRMVIAAAERGARGVGIDIDRSLVERSLVNADEAGVLDRVEFRCGNFFQADIAQATVVTLYLLRKINKALLPKLLGELAPGTRLISHSFEIADWPAEEMTEVETKFLFRWTIPR